ncbi:MAG: selenium metabolism-associated LysR family transcriptional regulator [Oscillospiraceae bacterium]|nr:selenium metabolism-associated LysR family transcriptional regulator [Oscillospiraceae bacterium]
MELNKMELKQLEAFVKVFELRSFSKAAEEMFLSQPSISAYINSLEKELQTQLIYRSTKEFLPTKSGEFFYEYAKEMLSLRDKSVSALKSLSDCTTGSIDILASSVPAQYILPEILGAYHKIYPSVVFNVDQADSSDVIKGISACKSEIGFVGSKIATSKCVYENFLSEKLIMIAPREKRFEKMDPIDAVSLLRDEYFIMREAGSGTRLEYEEYLRCLGVKIDELKVSAYFNNTHGIIQAVSNGLGLSIVSELAAKQYIRKKIIIPIKIDALPQRNLYIVLKKNYAVSTTVDSFIKFIHKFKGKYKG